MTPHKSDACWKEIETLLEYDMIEQSCHTQDADPVERMENTNLRILEWMRDVKNGSGEGQSIQQVDVSAGKHINFFSGSDLPTPKI